ncbi:MAG: SHOCT domain-containing protein [Thermodesulfovibrionales bacterium]
MNFIRTFVASIIIILGLGLTGCGGGGAEVKAETVAETSAQTLGQELIDLKKAYDMGIITEREYNESKQKLIEKKTGSK